MNSGGVLLILCAMSCIALDLSDSGKPFGDRGNGYSYGWTSDLSQNTRDRNSSLSPDERYDTGILTGTDSSTRWEIAVPNGTYSVRIVAGDALAWDSRYVFQAEGTKVVDGTPTEAKRWLEGTSSIRVQDARLTVSNGVGALNNKLCFVEIKSIDATSVTKRPTRALWADPGTRMHIALSEPFVRSLPELITTFDITGRKLTNSGATGKSGHTQGAVRIIVPGTKSQTPSNQ